MLRELHIIVEMKQYSCRQVVRDYYLLFRFSRAVSGLVTCLYEKSIGCKAAIANVMADSIVKVAWFAGWHFSRLEVAYGCLTSV